MIKPDNKDRQMNIAFLVGPFPKITKIHIVNQVSGLLERGHSVTIISTSNPDEDIVHEDVKKYNLIDRTFYYQSHAPNNTVLSAVKLLPGLARRTKQNPALVRNLLTNTLRDGVVETGRLAYWSLPFFESEFDIIHCHFGPNGVRGAKLKRLGVTGKLVTTFHGYGIEISTGEGKTRYEELFDRAELLLGNSTHTCEKLEEFGADAAKIKRHPPAIDPDRFSCRPPDTNESSGVPTVLTVARLAEEKGLDTSISAMKQLTKIDYNVNYRIVGDGPWAEKLRRQVVNAEIEDIVTFCGALPYDDVIGELERADIFLLPSRVEELGVVLLEAQASCLPIVATSVGGIPDAVDSNNSALLVSPGDVNALTEIIKTLIDQPERWEQMGRHGRKYVEENYHTEKLNEKLINLYQSIL